MLSRRLHKWLALLVGAQLVVWAMSGFFMVAVHIDIIHGDMLVKPVEPALGPWLDDVVPIHELVARYPGTGAVSLISRNGQPVYQLEGEQGQQWLDATSGKPMPRLSAAQAAVVASRHYAGDAAVSRTALIENDPPGEIAFLPLPVWRIDFADAWGTSFYIDPQTGHFMTRRHTLWRVFDFLWMLHIMDYDTREDINNPVLRIAATAALLLVLTGAWLLYLRFVPAGRRP